MTSDNGSPDNTITDVEWTEESAAPRGPWQRVAGRFTQPRRWLTTALRAAAALAAGLVLAAGAWLWIEVAQIGARLADLEAGLSSLESEVAALDTAPAADPRVDGLRDRLAAAEASIADATRLRGERLAALDRRMADLALGLDAIEKAPAVTPAAADRPLAAGLRRLDEAAVARDRRIEALESRVAALLAVPQSPAGSESADAAFVIALGQLREAIDSGGAYTDALETVAALEAADADVLAALEVLARHAGSGVAAQGELEDALREVLASAVEAEKMAAADGWFEESLVRFESLVTVRRIDGDATGTDTAAVAFRIEARVADGDLEGALREVGTLPAPAAAAMEGWAADARARSEALGALDRLHAWAVSRLAAGPE